MPEHYHRYEKISENRDGIVEVCKTCGKRLITKKDRQGKIDNIVYGREHIADIAQPTGRTAKIFKQVYQK